MSEPLPRAMFDAQLRAIVEHYGSETLTTRPGEPAMLRVFAGETVLEVVAACDPRYRYGLSFQSGGSCSTFEDWIASGEAFEEYLAMNVCRFGCG